MQIYNYLHNYQNWVTCFRLPNLGNAVVWECGLPAAYLSQKLKHRSLSTVLSRVDRFWRSLKTEYLYD